MWDEKNITDQTNKSIIITGANVGIGYETALVLYKSVADNIITYRDNKKAEDTRDKLEKENEKGNVEIGILEIIINLTFFNIDKKIKAL